jgi:hypothetical protein
MPPHVLIPPLSRDEQTSFDLNAIAKEAVSALDDRRRIAPFSRWPGEPGVADACALPAPLRSAFEARGKKDHGAQERLHEPSNVDAHGVRALIWATAPIERPASRRLHGFNP